jgi:hypothetical protein
MHELVLDYWLTYKIATQTVLISVRTASGWNLVDELAAEKAVFLTDMLRNEKPVFFVPGTNLHTHAEAPGEEEA